MYAILDRVFFQHPNSTKNPQHYWPHFNTAFLGSLTLIWAGLVGLVHAVIPALWPFYTSSQIIRAYRALEQSGRHDQEIRNILGKDRI